MFTKRTDVRSRRLLGKLVPTGNKANRSPHITSLREVGRHSKQGKRETTQISALPSDGGVVYLWGVRFRRERKVERKPTTNVYSERRADSIGMEKTPVTQKPSANKVRYEKTPPNGKVVRQDTPQYQAKPHKRRRRARNLAKGLMYFTEKDRQLMEWTASFGFIRAQDLAALMDVGRDAIRMRSNRLLKHGLLIKSYGLDGGLILSTTSKGLRAAGLEGYRPKIEPRATTLYHSIGEVAGVRWLAERFVSRPVLTERDLEAAKSSGVLTSRVTKPHPWVNGYGADFTKWTPDLVGGKGSKRPDLLVLWRRQDGSVKPPIPVEVELSPKSTKDYENWLRTYGETAREGAFSPGLLVLVDGETKSKGIIEAALKRAAKAAMDPISGKTPWANLDVRIESLGDYFTSYRRACLVRAPMADRGSP